MCSLVRGKLEKAANKNAKKFKNVKKLIVGEVFMYRKTGESGIKARVIEDKGMAVKIQKIRPPDPKTGKPKKHRYDIEWVPKRCLYWIKGLGGAPFLDPILKAERILKIKRKPRTII